MACAPYLGAATLCEPRRTTAESPYFLVSPADRPQHQRDRGVPRRADFESMAPQPQPLAPAEGERRALFGYVAQYKVAAEKIFAPLNDGRLATIGVADPEAGRLDDVQLISEQRSGRQLDAYQVKW